MQKRISGFPSVDLELQHALPHPKERRTTTFSDPLREGVSFQPLLAKRLLDERKHSARLEDLTRLASEHITTKPSLSLLHSQISPAPVGSIELFEVYSSENLLTHIILANGR